MPGLPPWALLGQTGPTGGPPGTYAPTDHTTAPPGSITTDANGGQVNNWTAPNNALVGGSAQGTAQTKGAISDATAARSSLFNQTGGAAQGTMAGISNDLGIRGMIAGGNQAGYQNNAQQDSALSGADRANQIDSLNQLQKFYDNGPGPSAAQAQLQQGNAATQAQNTALSRSARGGVDPTASRNLAFQNAAQNQTTAQQSNVLGAQEAADWRTQQGAALAAQQAGLGNVRSGDLSTMSGNITGGVNAANQGLDMSKLGATTTSQGQELGLGYAGQAAGSASHQDDLRTEYMNAMAAGATSEQLGRMGYATQMNDLSAHTTAGIVGGVGSGVAGIAKIAGGKDTDKSSDVHMKRRILPMPENY